MDDIYLTKEGHQKMVEELEYLQKVKRKEFSRAVAEARAHGDLGENAEYDAAKDAQADNERRIAELEYRLSCARIIDDLDIPSDEVLIGATVTLLDLDRERELQYILVSECEADFEQGKISVTSPLGRGLLNHRQDETVEISVPAGILRYKILKISRD